MTREAALQIALFVVCALAIYLIGSNDQVIVAALPRPLRFLCIAGLGFLFHWIRGKFRIVYGGIEVYVALFAIGSVTLDVHNIASAHDEYLAELIGSVYLIVRGLENIANYRGNDRVLRSFSTLIAIRAYDTRSRN
jgi:hypothetical protein